MAIFRIGTSLICFLLGFEVAICQTCCSGGVPISGNLGMPHENQGTWQFSLNYDINVLKTLKEGTQILDDNARERVTRSLMFQTGYSITKQLSADVFLSYVKQERTIKQFNNTDFVSTSGIGDAALLIKYALSNPSEKNLIVTVAAGPKIPTGRTDFTRKDGIPLNADLQPGSGSWDGIFWINGFHKLSSRPSFHFSTTFIYSLKGKNNNYLSEQTYQFGNELQGLFSMNDNIPIGANLLDLTLFIRYRKGMTDHFNDIEMPNTGGEWLFISPSIGYNINQVVAINGTFELPIYARVTGTQLSPTYRLNFGIFLRLNRPNKLI